MALNKVNYVDNQTIITAQNLNDIQNEIIQNAELIKKAAPRNLLDNSDFRNPVNQQGFVSGMVVKPYAGFIDRWINGEGSSIAPNLNSNGIQSNGAIFQILDLSAYIGKKMTLAAGFSDGNVVIASGTLTEASTNQELSVIFSTMDGTNGIGIGSMNGVWMAAISYPNSIIQWAALYEGEYTTETLPEYQPKGYANELLVCRQYDPSTGEYIGLSKFSPPRNLLDNSDFSNPINQRGISWDYQYFSNAYTIDRWILDNRTGGQAGIKLSETGVAISNSGNYSEFMQYVIADTEKKYTLAVGTGDGVKILSGVPSANPEIQFLKMKKSSQGYVKCYILIPRSEITLHWAALYEGEYTAETLPEYQPKGYGAELAECQRYYYKHKASTALFAGCLFNTGVVRVGYILPVPMIKTPSVDVSSTNFDKIDMYAISKVTTHPTAISVNMFSKDSTFISLALNWSFSATSGTAANVRFNTEFSLIADL